jgi:2-C-methyl-D-erythritol 4-phosphate cytidylyltransferase
MVEWSIEAFRACGSVDSIVVAVPRDQVDDLSGSDAGGHGGSVGGGELRVVSGGATRAQSVANALAAVGTELVAIHDAARPLLTPELVEALVARLDAAPDVAGVIPATPVTDTIKRSAGIPAAFTSSEMGNTARVVERTLDRSQLWAAQTPQVFRVDALRAALEVDAATRDAATDEAMLVEATGGTVLIHRASPQNLKVTTPMDLQMAELLLEGRSR